MSDDLEIKNHRLVGVPYRAARTIGGVIKPRIFIVHDTASRLTHGNAATYLRNNKRKVSVHTVLERDGSIEQQAPLNRRTNHAGRSEYHGRRHANKFSIGLETVNPGKLTYAGKNKARAWYGQLFDIDEYGIREVTTREHGSGFWMPYTEEQIAGASDIIEACVDKYGLRDVVGHWYVSPGRKIDTNPLFPLEQIKSRVLGREPEVDDEPDQVADAQPGITSGDFGVVDTGGPNLNLRRWPSFNPNIIGSIPHGTRVPILKAGEFDGRRWIKVVYDGLEGWVVQRLVDEI